MGWFWSDAAATRPTSTTPIAPHPMPAEGATPPPGCPMHASSASSTSPPPSFPPQSNSNPPPASCPVKHDQPSSTSTSTSPSTSTSTSSSALSRLNPLNYMPTLSNAPAPSQPYSLPTTRETSSIPRGDADANWEYPSPQQMYNAMMRKGGLDADQVDAVESMVAVHNYLNEGAWAEIRAWERRFAGGLSRGWRESLKGERRWAEEEEARLKQVERMGRLGGKNKGVEEVGLGEPKLLRFMGRPKDLSPKARVMQWMGWAWPAQYSTDLPFDRHDWFVQRQLTSGKTKEVRYVIDYYSAPPEPTGEPVFYLDVRPAVDGPTAAAERLMRWGGDVWYRASGAETRMQPQQ